jgi:MFS family permease
MGAANFLIGGVLSSKYGVGNTVISMIIGCLILWLIGLTTTAISIKGNKRLHAIENVVEYLGKSTGVIIALVLMLTLFFWYTIGLYEGAGAISHGLNETFSPFSAEQIGIAFGLLAALLSMRGLKNVILVSVISFPFLLVFSLYLFAVAFPSKSIHWEWGVSIPVVVVTAANALPGVMNLPTILRHSRSTADSFCALSLMTFSGIFFGTISALLDFSVIESLFDQISIFGISIMATITLSLFVFANFLCINILNIYLISSAWEAISQKKTGPIVFGLVGLLGTVVYALFYNEIVINTIINSAIVLIAVTGILLLISFVIREVATHRRKTYDKAISNICCGIGLLVSIILQCFGEHNIENLLLPSIGISLLVFLLLVFIEEVVWAAKQVSAHNK